MEFTNLRKELTKQLTKEHAENIKDIEGLKEVNQIFERWTFSELLTKLRQKQLKEGTLTLNDAKFLMIKKATKNYNKKLSEKIQHIDDVASAPDLKDATLSIEWKRSYMWGNNPTCDAKINTSNHYEYYSSGSIGGCGYDKQSTSVAKALNQCKSVLKELYKVKNKPENINKNNHDIFGYGSGYGFLPYIEGGAGCECYNRIFNTCGFEFKSSASGKTFDAWTITKN